jgi:hypothetical protein
MYFGPYKHVTCKLMPAEYEIPPMATSSTLQLYTPLCVEYIFYPSLLLIQRWTLFRTMSHAATDRNFSHSAPTYCKAFCLHTLHWLLSWICVPGLQSKKVIPGNSFYWRALQSFTRTDEFTEYERCMNNNVFLFSDSLRPGRRCHISK